MSADSAPVVSAWHLFNQGSRPLVGHIQLQWVVPPLAVSDGLEMTACANEKDEGTCDPKTVTPHVGNRKCILYGATLVATGSDNPGDIDVT